MTKGGRSPTGVPDNTRTAVIKACLYDPRSIAPIAEWRSITTAPFCQPGRGGHAIRPKSSRRCSSSRDGFWAVASSDFLQSWRGQRRNRRTPEASQRGATDPAAWGHTAAIARRDRSPGAEAIAVEAYVFCEWHSARVGIDYHVDVRSHYYSVPYRCARAAVEVRLTARTVEIFLKGERIAAHMRMSGNHKHTTVAGKTMPSATGAMLAGRSIASVREARLIGPATTALCELILEQRSHPEQGFRACLGNRRLARSYGTRVLKWRRSVPAISAPAPTARSNPSSTPTSIGLLRNRAPRTARDPSFQHPWSALLQLGETIVLNHPTLDQLHALVFMVWPGLSQNSTQAAKRTVAAIANGSGCCLIARSHGARTSGSRHGCGHARLRQQA